jgi:hypothetical protein
MKHGLVLFACAWLLWQQHHTTHSGLMPDHLSLWSTVRTVGRLADRLRTPPWTFFGVYDTQAACEAGAGRLREALGGPHSFTDDGITTTKTTDYVCLPQGLHPRDVY